MKLQKPYLLFLGSATDVLSVKIANSIVDWRPDYCVGELKLPDCTISKGLSELTIDEAVEHGAKTLVITVNNSGGHIESAWVPTILAALKSGLDVASGMHERLADHSAISAAATRYGRALIDVRHTTEKLRTGDGQKRTGKRLLTVGTDCSAGKMYTSLALEREMQSRGLDAKFVATGQCGIFVSGSGIAIDTVVADFISGAAEQLTPDNDPEHWDIIEGQGALTHASFAGVSLGLLHGSQPNALVLCHAEGRRQMRGLPGYEPPELHHAMAINLQAARVTNPDARFIGVAVNTSSLSEADGRARLDAYEQELQIPCVDPLRTGVGALVDNLTG